MQRRYEQFVWEMAIVINGLQMLKCCGIVCGKTLQNCIDTERIRRYILSTSSTDNRKLVCRAVSRTDVIALPGLVIYGTP